LLRYLLFEDISEVESIEEESSTGREPLYYIHVCVCSVLCTCQFNKSTKLHTLYIIS